MIRTSTYPLRGEGILREWHGNDDSRLRESWGYTSIRLVDFFVLVYDRDAAGVARAIAGPGKMGMRYMNGWDRPTPLLSWKTYHQAIDLRPFAHTFRKGHRLGILIRSEWFPAYERNLNTGKAIKLATRMETGTETILHSQTHPSILRLWQLDEH